MGFNLNDNQFFDLFPFVLFDATYFEFEAHSPHGFHHFQAYLGISLLKANYLLAFYSTKKI